MSVVSSATEMADPQLGQTDAILLLLGAETADPRQRFRCDGITRLEKLLFLIEHETEFAAEVAEPFAFEAATSISVRLPYDPYAVRHHGKHLLATRNATCVPPYEEPVHVTG